MTYPKTLQALIERNRNLIDEVVDERADDNGWWIYLKPGYWNPLDEVHCIHENTIAELRAKLRTVERCTCEQCR